MSPSQLWIFTQVWVPFCGAGFDPNREMVGYSHNIHDIIAPVGISCQDCYYCSFQGTQLDKIVDDFFNHFFWYYECHPSRCEDSILVPGQFILAL